MSGASDASLPPVLEQLRSLTSFKQLDEKHLSSAACKGISVPVQHSLPPVRTAERHMCPSSAVAEDLGHPPSCRAITRSARPPAEGGVLTAS